MTHSRVYWLTCILMLATAVTASATTIVMPSDDQLIQKSPLIVRATVLSSTPVDRAGAIWSESVLHVEQTLKGEAVDSVTVREIGGVLGDRITKIYGAPRVRRRPARSGLPHADGPRRLPDRRSVRRQIQ